MNKGILIGIIGVLLIIGSSTMCAPTTNTNTNASTTQTAPSAETQQLQSKRLDLINELIAKGVFYKVEMPGSLPHVWVTPLFNSLDFDTKSQFINVVYAYYHTLDPKIELVLLYDNRTGKEVGKYAAVYGGLKLE